MPARKIPLVTNEIYHVINRGNASMPIFKKKYDYQKFIQTFLYYQNDNLSFRFSKLLELSQSEKEEILKKLKIKKDLLIEIIAYCLMPNHYHFILMQAKDEGITNFIRLFANSYSRYFNAKYKRKGGLFENRFKAVRIETNAQLLHLSRYVHLNPYSSYLLRDFKNLIKFPFCSFPEYIGKSKTNICNKELILSQFSNLKEYKNFVLDRADYQRTLEEIKHQLLED